MKRILISSILLMVVAFQSCNFNKSFKKDLVSGAVFKADGLGSDDVKMTVNGIQTVNNTFTFGDKVEFIFNNVTGLKRKKGKVFPGMSMYLIINGTDTLIKSNDLLIELKNGTDLNPLLLKSSFKAPQPENEDDKYMVIIKIRDEKGPGKILYEMPFRVKNSSFLSIQANEIEYSTIYLWNETEKKVVNDKNINQSDEYVLIIEGLDGLDRIENTVFPAIELEITDKKGNTFVNSKNILEHLSQTGLEYDYLKENQIPVTLSFTAGRINNPCQFKATITDLKNPNKKVFIQADMVIE